MLALCIGATTASLSVVEGVSVRPLPFTDPTASELRSWSKHRDREMQKRAVFYRLFRIAVPSGVPKPVQASHPRPALYPLTVFLIALVPDVTSFTTPFATFAY